MGDVYQETGSTTFPTSSFSWREISVAGLPGWRGAPPASGAPDTSRNSSAGGFHYSGSALVSSSLCRNRFILWQCRGSSLYLLELSLDCSLAHAALRVEVRDGSTVVPDVSVRELEGSSVAVLFATTSAVFRLLLPHPDAISKNPALSSAGGGLQPSVLASAEPSSLQGSNMAALFSQHSSAQPVSCVCGWISPRAATTFALASPSGSIHLIHLPSPQDHGLPVRTELKQVSVINRLWASVVPNAFRGGGVAEDAPVSVAMHSFGGNVVVLALCRDVHLRLWATEPAECIMTCDMAEYLLQDSEVDSSLSASKLCLRKAAGGTVSSLRFVVYIETHSGAQVSVFQLMVVDRQLHLEHVHSCPCGDRGDLVEVSCTNTAVWAVWRTRDGDSEETLVQHLTYDGERCHGWQSAHVSSPPPRDVSLTHTSEPRSVYLEALLHPGRFATSSINKALELYGSMSVRESVQELRQEATVTVERELLSSADSTQLHHDQFRELQVKCWTKFYGCCHQYQQLMSQVVGVFQDPTTGLVCLFKDEMLSFMYPASPADCLALEGQLYSDDVSSDDVSRFMEAVRIARNQLNSEALESLLSSAEPSSLASELADAIAHQPARESVLSAVSELVGGIVSVPEVLRAVAAALDPTADHAHMDASEGDMPDTELQLALSQLFSSPLCERLLAGCVRETCLTRMTLARDILLLICVLQHGELQVVEQSHVDQFSSLLKSYHCLYWLCCRPTLPASPTSLDHNGLTAALECWQVHLLAFLLLLEDNVSENNLRQLAALNISTSSSRSPPINTECSVLEVYVRGVGGQGLRAALLRTGALPSGTALFSLWTNLLPQAVTILLAQLWPSTNSVAVCQFLLSACQYTHLQDYVSEAEPVVVGGHYSLHFLLAQSYLTTGETDKATDHFFMAADGLNDPSETLLQQITRSSAGNAGEEEEEGGEGEEGRGVGGEGGERKLRYYLKVMSLFEQVPSPLAVLSVAETAVRHADSNDPLCVVLWSTLFKYRLDLGHHEKAYEAMMANPDPVRRRECLRHFVVILTELRQLKLLCNLTYPGMEEDIEKVIEDRARSVDVIKHKYYDLLYCFHATRQNYRKAASVMYEYGLRLGREAPGTQSLKKQANCYCMCLTALHLAQSQYAWVAVPVDLGEILAQNTKKSLNRKRAHPSQASQQQVEVRTIEDIEKEYALVRTKLSLLRREPSMATQICSPFVSAEEVVARLVQVGLFDKAVDTALRFELPLDSIFEALASRCVHLSVNMMAFREGAEDVSTWNWLGANESIDVPTPTEKTVVDKAWLMLKLYLETHDPSHNHQLQKCVARKLLSLGSHLPQWIVKTYKETNPAELLRLYLTFDLLEEAAHLALDYIDAVLGPQKQEFALKTTLHASSPSVWLPYSALDHLQVALQRAQRNTPLAELSSQLSAKLELYFRTASSVSADMEHHARQRMMAEH